MGPNAVIGGPWVSGPFDWPVPKPWTGRVILVGDAAGYYDPLTGQGIYRALRSAELASAAVDEALRRKERPARTDGPARPPRSVPSDPLRRYAHDLRRDFATGRRVQHAVEAVLSRRTLRKGALTLLGRTGWLDRVVRITGDVASLGRADPGRTGTGLEA